MVDQEQPQLSPEDRDLVDGVEDWLQQEAQDRAEIKSQLTELGLAQDSFFAEFETKDVAQALVLALPLKKQLEHNESSTLAFQVRAKFDSLILKMIAKGADRHQKEFKRSFEANWYEVAMILLYLMKDDLDLAADSDFHDRLDALNSLLKTDYQFF